MSILNHTSTPAPVKTGLDLSDIITLETYTSAAELIEEQAEDTYKHLNERELGILKGADEWEPQTYFVANRQHVLIVDAITGDVLDDTPLDRFLAWTIDYVREEVRWEESEKEWYNA